MRNCYKSEIEETGIRLVLDKIRHIVITLVRLAPYPNLVPSIQLDHYEGQGNFVKDNK